MPLHKTAIIVGAGPAGLMAAEILVNSGIMVRVYDSMPSPCIKFLSAGKGGLNITHSEPFEKFLSRYGSRKNNMEPLISEFPPDELRNWVHSFGIKTFTGSSGRVFPEDMKAKPLLKAWLERLGKSGVNFHMRHKWQGWDKAGNFLFKTANGEKKVHADAAVLATGGGSRHNLGSDGSWTKVLEQQGISVALFRPSNCGFDVCWSDYFVNRFSGDAVKPAGITFINNENVSITRHGEFMVTSTGVEGSLIYALSADLRDRIETDGSAVIHLDLYPAKDVRQISARLAIRKNADSISNHLRKKTGLYGVKTGLLHEILPKGHFTDYMALASAIKNLPLKLLSARPVEEAISTAGGLVFEELDSSLMIKKLPGIFCAGEMLDWEAPTGGYLLTACFASGRAAGFGAVKWLTGG